MSKFPFFWSEICTSINRDQNVPPLLLHSHRTTIQKTSNLIYKAKTQSEESSLKKAPISIALELFSRFSLSPPGISSTFRLNNKMRASSLDFFLQKKSTEERNYKPTVIRFADFFELEKKKKKTLKIMFAYR